MSPEAGRRPETSPHSDRERALELIMFAVLTLLFLMLGVIGNACIR